ncbi:MAG: carboxypeptidase regulatory-like domain-containing protein, partial [Planctomycetota bacterium]
MRDLVSRRPLANAAVVAWNRTFTSSGAGRPIRPVDLEVRASTDSEGRFEVRVPFDREYTVSATLPGFAEGGASASVRTGATEPLVGILLPPLPPGRVVRGRVVDSRGEPPRHALVTASPRWNPVRARSDGTFEIRNLPPGRQYLHAWAPGVLSAEEAGAEVLVPAEGEAPPVLLVLRIPGGIEGRVRVRGRVPPVPIEVCAGFRSAFTDREGRFELFPLAPGEFPIYLRARAPSRITLLQGEDLTALRAFRGAPAEATVVEGQTTYVEIDASDAVFMRMHGGVFRKDEPVVGARVRLPPRLSPFRNDASAHPSKGATTGVDGTFEFWTDESGWVDVSVYEADFPLPALTRTERLEAGGEREIRFDLVTAQVEGTCADASGSALAGVAVNLALPPSAPPGLWMSGSVVSGPDGTF